MGTETRVRRSVSSDYALRATALCAHADFHRSPFVEGLRVACGIGLVLANLLVLTVANTNAQDTDLRLIDAVKRQDTEAVRVLLEEPVNVDASQVDGATALHWAAYRDDVPMATLLIASGANVNAPTRIGNLIPIVMEVASGRREKMKVFGDNYSTKDGTGVRDYIHVTDIALAHINALEYLNVKKKNITINLSTGKGYSVFEIINKIEEISGNIVSYHVSDRRDGDLDTLIATYNKAKSILNWEPINSDIETILITTWNVYEKK